MRIGSSIFLIAVGAILKFALSASIDGIDLGVTGVILMVLGTVGLLLSLFLWNNASPAGRRAVAVDGGVVQETETITTRETDTRL